MLGHVVGIALPVAQQQGDAIVGTGHDELTALAADLLRAAAAQAVPQHDGLGLRFPLDHIDRLLGLASGAWPVRCAGPARVGRCARCRDRRRRNGRSPTPGPGTR